ncbi:MAG: DUF6226 family protein [Ilumatobacteraceae bacterium]
MPTSGCDACDAGSANELEHLDDYLDGDVGGALRRVIDGSRTIIVIGDDLHITSGFDPRSRDEVAAVLADPTGWREPTGGSWLDGFGPAQHTATIR